MDDRWIRTVAMPQHGGGGGTDYWETLWADEKLEVPDFLVELLRPLVAPCRRVLESGCGTGAYVRLLSTEWRQVVGVDLAARALVDARHRDPELELAVADVARLPFPPATFDALLSLGVIEHFEGGPGAVLAEQRRVLAPGGRLILTVPQRSWVRAAQDRWHFSIRRRRTYARGRRTVQRRRQMEAGAVPSFHQYEFGRAQVLAAVRAAGLEVVRCEGVDVGTGLRDLRRHPSVTGPRPAPDRPQRTSAAASPSTTGLRSWVRRTVFGVGPVGPAARLVRTLTGRAIGHTLLVVAVAPGGEGQRVRSAMAEATPSE